MSKREHVKKAKALLEQVTYQVNGSGAALSDEEKRATLLNAAQEMQKAQIVLKGPKFIKFEDGAPKDLPVTYVVLFEQIRTKVKPESLSDVADSLLSLHDEFSKVQGGRRHTKKPRKPRRRSKKTRRSTRRS